LAVSSRLDGWVENRPEHGLRRLDIRELWEYRELAAFLALRDVKVRYKQAVFGAAWALLQPVVGVVVFTIVFRRLAEMPSDGLPYPLFSFVALSVWAYISTSVTKATQSLVSNESMVSKVYFPRIIAPMAAVLPGLLDLCIAFVLLGLMMAVYGVAPTWALLTLPLWILAAAAVSLGVGLWLGTINVSYRDVNQAIALLVQMWLFISPVAYPSSAVEGVWGRLYALNPVVGVNDLMDPATIAHLLRYDSIHGRYPGTVEAGEDSVTVAGH
jgi:lipopolysaccharide transport system permease protein